MTTNLYCIYMHQQKNNGKVYIGQTKQEVKARWRKNGRGYKNCPKFYQAIEEFGWDSFIHTILETGLTAEEADEREAYYIALYDSVNNGYNTYSRNYGGYHFAELWADENKRKQMIEKLTAMRNTPEYHEQQSAMMKDMWKNESYRAAQKASWTDERRERCSELAKKNWEDPELRKQMSKANSENMKKNWQNPEYRKKKCKQVICTDTGEVFESIRAAAAYAGVKDNTLCMALKSASHKSGKHPETGEPLHWRYYEEVGAGKEGGAS